MAKWTIVKEKQRNKVVLTVRRFTQKDHKSKVERYPIQKYRHLQNNPQELKLFVMRLNESSRERVEIRHAFISTAMLDEYRELLETQRENKVMARCEFMYVRKYFLGFFVDKENIMDPIHWHQVQKTKWAAFLLSKDAPRAMSTKKQIVHAANKFMKWLHEQRPTEVPVLRFEPFDLSRIKQIEYDEKRKGERRATFLISERDYKKILDKLDKALIPIVSLAWSFGLRRNEAMGLTLENVKNGHLLITQQLLSIGKYGPPKGRQERKIPYWDSKPLQTYQWIKELPKIHPRTFNMLWDKTIEELFKETAANKKIEHKYTPHDLRHSWITRMIRKHEPRDVQLASGHVNLNTTMGYLHDDRNLDDQLFVPDKKSS